MQLDREGSPPPGLRLPQAKLSRKSNQVARGRIRQFESYMPSHAVRSPRVVIRAAPEVQTSSNDLSLHRVGPPDP
jgi:hypothetical protein